MTRRRKAIPTRRKMRGALPGEYLKVATVSIPLSFVYGSDGRTPFDNWIVSTRLHEKRWEIAVEHKGDEYVIPHEVMLQIVRHQRAIEILAKEDRVAEKSERMKESMRKRMEAGLIPFQRAQEGGA